MDLQLERIAIGSEPVKFHARKINPIMSATEALNQRMNDLEPALQETIKNQEMLWRHVQSLENLQVQVLWSPPTQGAFYIWDGGCLIALF